MRTIVLATRAGKSSFERLVEAVSSAGHRVGWLEWGDVTLLEQCSQGALFRAVAVGPDGVVATKRVRGQPILRDLLREYFKGCRLVLARGSGRRDLPSIEAEGPEWIIELPGGGRRRYTTDALARELSRPHPWGQWDPQSR